MRMEVGPGRQSAPKPGPRLPEPPPFITNYCSALPAPISTLVGNDSPQADLASR